MLKKGDVMFFAVLSVLYGVLVRQYVPTIDDLGYAFGNAKSPEEYHAIVTVWDAVLSQCHDYMAHNGRVVVHFMVECMTGMRGGREVFFVMTAVVFFLFLCGLTILTRSRWKGQTTDRWLSPLYVMLFVPNLSLIFMGMITYVVDYMWTSAAMVWLFVLWRHIDENPHHRGLAARILMFFAAMLTCMMHEGFSIPVTSGLCLSFFLRRKFPEGDVRWLFWGMLTGTSLCALAPANVMTYFAEQTQRANGGYTGMFALMKSMAAIIRSVVLWQFVVLHIIMISSVKWADLRRFIGSHVLYYCIIAVAFAFALIVAYHNDNQLMPASLCIYLIAVDFIMEHHKDALLRFQRLVAVGTCICAMVFFLVGRHVRGQLCEAWQVLTESALNGKRDCEGRMVYDLWRRWNGNPLVCRMVNIEAAFAHLRCNWFNEVQSVYLTDGSDLRLIRSILPTSPQNIVAACTSENMVKEGVFECAEGLCYVVRLPDAEDLSVLSLEVRTARGAVAAAVASFKERIGYPGGLRSAEYPLCDLQAFTDNGYTYFVVYEWGCEDVSLVHKMGE